MEDTHYYELLDYFSTIINVVNEDHFIVVNNIPFSAFNRHSNYLASRFIGECNRNIEIYKDDPDFIRRELSNFRFKFLHYYEAEFGLPYLANTPPDLYKLVPEDDEFSKYKKEAIKSKLNVYALVLNFLEKETQQFSVKETPAKQKRIRIRADKRDFRTNLEANQLQEVLNFGKSRSLFSSKTNKKDFIDIFLGRSARGQIDWLGTVYALKRFINGINGIAIKGKITDGKWEVISELFTVNGKNINPSSLRNPGRGKNDKLNDVNNLIDLMNSPEPLDE